MLLAAGLSCVLLSTAVLCSSSMENSSAQQKLPPSQYTVPKGYEFHGLVEFTDQPNHGLPHMRLHESEANIPQPEDGWHTLLITPDGRSYKKPLAASLAELEAAGGAQAMLPTGELDTAAFERAVVARRQLRQAQVPPTSTIGVSTSISSLGCTGCGPDNRVQVTTTTVYPYMTIGQLIGQLGTSSLGLECTGTLIGKTHVLTAAHCVFDINASRKMVSNLNFAPALNGNTAPYGTLQWTQARIVTQFSSQPSYTTQAMDYDFALVTLSSSAVSGYLGLFFPPSVNSIDTVSLTTAGYPGSKPSGTMWSSACGSVAIDYSTNNAFANVAQCANGGCANILTHTCISSDGQSGSAIWDTNFQIRAILSGKVTVSNGNAYNVATEIDTEIYNQIASWYNEDGDPAGNGTLPLAPSGPGSQPSSTNAFVKFWKDNWGKPWFIAIFVFVCLAIAGIAFLILISVLRCSGCFDSKRRAPKSAVSYNGYPVVASSNLAQHRERQRSGLPPRPPQPLQSEGVTYDGASNQFVVNGRPYGQYQGFSSGSPNHSRTPSTTPLTR